MFQLGHKCKLDFCLHRHHLRGELLSSNACKSIVIILVAPSDLNFLNKRLLLVQRTMLKQRKGSIINMSSKDIALDYCITPKALSSRCNIAISCLLPRRSNIEYRKIIG